MRIEYLKPDSARWRTFLAGVTHDFYHVPGYVDLAAAHEGGTPEALFITEEDSYLFIPYVVRPLSNLPWLASSGDGWFDLVSPYGYPCPLVNEARPGFLAEAVARWGQAMRDRKTVTGFLRLHPLFEDLAQALRPFGTVARRGPTIAINLAESPDVIWRQFRSNHQRDIRKAHKLGLRATLDHTPASLAEFQAIYRESMDRVGAAELYYFPPEYFRQLSELLVDSLSLCLAWTPDGTAVAGLLLVECGPFVQYHLGGTRTNALASTPAKLLFDHAWRWARDRGRKLFHLGGGVGGAEDSLFQFKAGFSDRRYEFCNWQMVFCAETYRTLETRRRAAAPACRPDFFPAYRA